MNFLTLILLFLAACFCILTFVVFIVIAVIVIVIVVIVIYMVIIIKKNMEFPLPILNKLVYDSKFGEMLKLKRNPYDSSVYSQMNDAFSANADKKDTRKLLDTTIPSTHLDEVAPGESIHESSPVMLEDDGEGTGANNEMSPVMLEAEDEEQEKPKELYRAEFAFEARDSDEISFPVGEEFELLEIGEDDWWKVKNREGKTGMVPSNYIKKI